MAEPVYRRELAEPHELDALASIPGIRFQITHTPIYEGDGLLGTDAYGQTVDYVFTDPQAVKDHARTIPICDRMTVYVVIPAVAVEQAFDLALAKVS